MSHFDVSRNVPVQRSLAGLIIVAVLGAELVGGMAATAAMAKSVAVQAQRMMAQTSGRHSPGN